VDWSIAEVARMASVTSRTLRHYDDVGLLVPARTDTTGRRYYGRAELLRLQRILLLRGLGLGLDDIAGVLDAESDVDELTALRAHRERLAAERRRLGRLLRTVDETITSMEEGTPMEAERMFHGFEDDPYEDEARERWGDDVVDESYRRIRGWTPDQAERAATGYPRVHAGLAALRADGAAVDDPRVQALVDEHFALTSMFWQPDADSYRGLGRMYVEDERFRRNIGGGDDALVEFLRDAMGVYADTRLA
jgi:DNA-binding transcriptional MerR regulator